MVEEWWILQGFVEIMKYGFESEFSQKLLCVINNVSHPKVMSDKPLKLELILVLISP